MVVGSYIGGTGSDFSVARYNIDGNLDTTFNGSVALTLIGGTSGARLRNGATAVNAAGGVADFGSALRVDRVGMIREAGRHGGEDQPIEADDEATIRRRLENARREIAVGQQHYPIQVVNDDVDLAVEALVAVLKQYGCGG